MNGPLVTARAVHLAATLLLTGALTFRCFVAAPVFHGKAGAALEAWLRIRLASMIWAALAAALASGAAWLVLLSAEIGGAPVTEALYQGLPWTVLTQTTFGDAWMLRLEMAAVLAALLLIHDFASPLPRLRGSVREGVSPQVQRPWPGPLSDLIRQAGEGRVIIIDVTCVLVAAAFAASIAWTGHAAAMDGLDGAIHLTSDALHLVAAGAWIGALWPLALLLAAAGRAGDPGAAAAAWQATRRFSMIGMISVATILTTGVINTWEILGTAAFSVDTDYNRLLLVKIGLFTAMVAIAAYNRQRLTPRLSGARDYGLAIRQLRWNSLTETGLGLLILAIVAVLGRMTPHMHMHG
jgi:copper resistance protein D